MAAPVAVAVAAPVAVAAAAGAMAGLAAAGKAVDYQEARKFDAVQVTLCYLYPRYLQFQQSPVVHVRCCLQCQEPMYELQ